MSEQIAIDLRVLGHSFRLASTPDKQEELERAKKSFEYYIFEGFTPN